MTLAYFPSPSAIRRVMANGTIRAVVGLTGTSGSTGNGGLAIRGET